VIGDKPVDRMTLLANKDEVKVRRVLGQLPSRAADNLFWLGRYLERAEATLRLVRSLWPSLMDSETATHMAGENLDHIQRLLISWGAVEEDSLARPALEIAREALHNDETRSVVDLVRSARRSASSLRERLSSDFWTLVGNLENLLGTRVDDLLSEAEALQQIEAALQIMAALSGLAQDNMNRGPGWSFLDMGRRVERGINTCRLVRVLAEDDATTDDLDILLDLVDSQITYRARYLVGLALTPVRDMVMLDPFNPRSVAFQIMALKEHLAALPNLLDDGMLEVPDKILLPLATEIETSDAEGFDADRVLVFEQALMKLSNAIADRYFLQGANAVPTTKLAAFA